MSFILFFPTMVAGPIKRYQDFRPKLVNPSLDWDRDWQMGSTRILVGLAKKFVVADLLTAFTNHLTIPDIAQAQRWVLPIWLLAYGMKIYFDFSAYSDIAIGSARLFGIRVPENFDWPYLQTNIAEFWQHWHMSLYKWLVDYVFIPLGGSRTAQPRVYLNVLITMFLSGLWHGAGLNFVVWGLWHGMLLAVHRGWKRWRERETSNFKRQTSGKLQTSNAKATTGSELFGGKLFPRFGCALSWALTFVMVNLGWAFFCMDLKTAMYFFRRLFIG